MIDDFQKFSKAALKHIKSLCWCPLCRELIKINQKSGSSVLKQIFPETKGMLVKLLPKIFSLNKVLERITCIIVKEISPQRFSCSHHGESVLRETIELIGRQYIDVIVSFLNKVMSGQIIVDDANIKNSYVKDAYELYSKSIPKKKDILFLNKLIKIKSYLKNVLFMKILKLIIIIILEFVEL